MATQTPNPPSSVNPLIPTQIHNPRVAATTSSSTANPNVSPPFPVPNIPSPSLSPIFLASPTKKTASPIKKPQTKRAPDSQEVTDLSVTLCKMLDKGSQATWREEMRRLMALPHRVPTDEEMEDFFKQNKWDEESRNKLLTNWGAVLQMMLAAKPELEPEMAVWAKG
ncbi:hypothetical protein H0H93_012070, partial [Arthromyces matolae]